MSEKTEAQVLAVVYGLATLVLLLDVLFWRAV